MFVKERMDDMAQEEDYYAILGIDKSASQDDIQKAYRSMAKKWHPDVNHDPNATEMFEKITKAYDVLKDPQKRAAYDQFGSAAVDENGQAGFNAGGFNGFNQGADGFDVDDLFNQFFGGGRSRRTRQDSRSSGPVRGEDKFIRMKVSFMDAVNGRNVEMPYTYDSVCPTCQGKKAVNPSDVVACRTCGGSGVVVQAQRTMFGTFQTQTTCPDCNGSGVKIKNPCTDCHGTGYKTVKTNLKITVPAGIAQGQQLRVPNKGGRGLNGGPNGDLFIEIVIGEDKQFRREGNDIHIDLDVPLVVAVLGADVDIPTVYGTTSIHIDNGTQPGTILRVRGQGVKGLSGTGDEYVHLNIVVPKKITDKERELYEQIAQLADVKVSSKKTGIFKNIFKKK